MEQIRWKKLFLQASIWLFAEVLLTCIGTDDLADYSEFHFIYRDDIIARLEEGTGLIRFAGSMG
jgi:hypothetical protein